MTERHPFYSPRQYPRAFISYRDAQGRCRRPAHKNFAYYGGRGIRFEFASFREFVEHLGERAPGATLERIDNDSDYRPGNVRWATRQDQARNRRSNRILSAFGVTRTLATWAADSGLSPQTLRSRLAAGKPIEAALTDPLIRTGQCATTHQASTERHLSALTLNSSTFNPSA